MAPLSQSPQPDQRETPTKVMRASAMSPEARRAAIVAATLPLVLEHGAAVSTRMIAAAAGIAEGTVFRAFVDKESLLDAVVAAAFDPAPMNLAFAGIDPRLPFEKRLAAAVEIVQRRLADIWRLVATIGVDKVPQSRQPPTDLPGLAALFEPDRHRLRRDPIEAARMLRSLTLAFSHPTLVPDGPMSPEEIVSVLLDGIRSAPPRTRRAGAGRQPARSTSKGS